MNFLRKSSASSRLSAKLDGMFVDVVPVVRFATNIITVVMITALLIFMTTEVYDILSTSFLDPKSRNFLHDVALLLVFVKALKILTAYLESNRVAIKYLIEISIIAPAIEIIFAADRHSVTLIIVMAFFSLANLIIYVLWFDRIKAIDHSFERK